MKLISLAELKNKFEDKKVYIPLYQRNYKWTNSSTEKNGSGRLMKDILTKFRDNSQADFNLGMITVFETSEQRIQILDGQQRMITLSLIMKCIRKADQQNWIELHFERDRGFCEEDKAVPRHDYIYEDAGIQGNASVDVNRMVENYKSIDETLTEIQKASYGTVSTEELYFYMMNHIKVLYRETKREPIDEFLNINFNKTPFCAADYIKSYMIMEATEESGDTEKVTSKMIMDLWKRLEHVLYQLEETDKGLENDMFRLIKQHYNKYHKNRLEVLFEDRYYKKNEKTKDAEINCDSYHTEWKLDREYKKLNYYYTVMKNLLEELHVVDCEGKKHPNYTAYSAYNLLCEKNKGVRFFELFREEEQINVHDVLYKQFNLTNKSYNELEKMKDVQASNQFMETLLISEDTFKDSANANSSQWIGKVAWKNHVVKDSDKFREYHQLFKGRFDEFIDLVEMGKSSVVNICDGDDGRLVLEDLLKSDKVKQIKIPQIQRDYVMGSHEKYLLAYLCKIRFEELKEKMNCVAKEESEKVFASVNYTKNKDNNLKVEHITYGEFYDLLDKTVFGNRKDLLMDGDCKAEGFFESQLIPFNNNKNATRRKVFEEFNQLLQQISREIEEPNDYRRYTSGSYKECTELRDKIYGSMKAVIKEAQSIQLKEKIENKMSLSCIMGYLDENGTFWVYDGQQRLTTSVILLLHSLCKGNENSSELKKLLNKFSFDGRDGANHIIKSLLMNAGDSVDLETIRTFIDDQTGFAIYKVLKLLEERPEWQSISSDYLLRGMDFELIQMEELDDAEQLFVEMNEGLELTDAEMYKAQLCHVIKEEALKKDYILNMDNEWLDSWKSEISEVTWLKYCITMAYFEIKGYDAGRGRDSLHGVTDEIIALSYWAMDKFKAVDEHKKMSSKADELIYWLDTVRFETIETQCRNGKIYFSKDDFKTFLKRYMEFTKERGSDSCFRAIKEFRENGYVSVPMSAEWNAEEDAEKESEEQQIFRWMLESRLGRYAFRNTNQWEQNNLPDYDNEKFRTDYYYSHAPYGIYRNRNLKIPNDNEWMAKCNEEYIFCVQGKEDIKNNLGYYFYNNSSQNDKLWLELTASQKEDVRNAELTEDYKPIPLVYSLKRYIEWIGNLTNLYALPQYVQAIVELGIEKGLCYVDEMNAVKLTVNVSDGEKDFLSLLSNVQAFASLEEGWNVAYRRVISSVSNNYYESDLSEGDLLELYRKCDERFRNRVRRFIALYYLKHPYQKQLEYSAREYLKKHKEILDNLPFRFDFEECKSVLPWEWVSGECCAENHRISYIKDSGLGYEENGCWIYKPYVQN